jgi:hypothetical protein
LRLLLEPGWMSTRLWNKQQGQELGVHPGWPSYPTCLIARMPTISLACPIRNAARKASVWIRSNRHGPTDTASKSGMYGSSPMAFAPNVDQGPSSEGKPSVPAFTRTWPCNTPSQANQRCSIIANTGPVAPDKRSSGWDCNMQDRAAEQRRNLCCVCFT